MANPVVFNWFTTDQYAVAYPQNPGAGGSFILNGDNQVLSQTGKVESVSFGNTSRTVSVSSGFNDAGVNFTIKGTYAGNPVSQTIAGPNNDAVYTTQIYDTVTSVTIDANLAGNAGVGVGETGQTWWFKHNYHASVLGFTLTVDVVGTIEYTFQSTLDDVAVVTTPLVFNPIAGMTAATTNQYGSVLYPLRYSCIVINSSAPINSLTATFLQQGIT